MLAGRFVLAGRRLVANAAFTDRRGGYSNGEFGSFNLARHVGDAPELVAANRTLLATVVDLQADRLSFVSQVHGTDIRTVDESAVAHAAQGTTAEADAQLTTATDIGLVILVADCTPVLLADPDAGVVAAIHAGRKGMAAGIVPRTIGAMRAAGAEDVSAVVGPAICPRCYEVPAAMRDEVALHEPVTASVSRAGTPALDVSAGVVEQLRRDGVRIAHWEARCTFEDPELYSYRRDGTTGRLAGIVWLTAK